jgi:acetyltransferase-like isoleucine patch superfamily enzyme
VGLGANRTIGRRVTIRQGFRFKRKLIIKIGDDSKINEHVSFTGKQLTIGRNSRVLSRTSIDCTGGVLIGSNTQIGRRNEIYSHKHLIGKKDVPVLQSPEEMAPVSIGDDVMFFSNVKLMPGVQVADGVVALNGAVLTKDAQAYGIYGGLPAKKVGQRE